MQTLINAFNELKIPDMPELLKLYGHKGSAINFEVRLPNGGVEKIFEDNKIYYTAELKNEEKNVSFFLVTDKTQLVVLKAKANDKPQIIIWKLI
jgi:hypothetical protein